MKMTGSLGACAGIRFFLLPTLLVLFFFGAPALAASPLAVIKSDKNAETYSEQHLGTFDEDYLSFKRTLENANVRYDTLSDNDLRAGIGKLSPYKMLILPFLVDVPPDAVPVLADYVRGGGKLLITDGGGVPTANAQALINLTGVKVTKHSAFVEQNQLNWQRQPQPFLQDFAVGTLKADLEPIDPNAAAAKWTDPQGQDAGIAISRLNGNTFLSWAPGLQGEITTNAQIMSLAMEDAVPGIIQQAAVQISFADYQNIQQELEYLTKRTDEAIKTAKQADLAVPFKAIQAHFESALAHVKTFQDAYSARRFYQADEELSAAREDFALAFAQSMPVRPVESRAVWLDRGTIVAAKNQAGLGAVFDRLRQAGVNVVYFETNNAGFCTFPTKVSVQNPQTIGWDPLGAAVIEAKKRGMELHAWMWTFAVGNLRHNPILNKEADYPGPVLSTKDIAWGLARQNGAMLPNNQPEFWIDPSNAEGRQFIKDLATEIVTNYAVDGLQFDYVRYPFNGKGTEMGYDWGGRMKFERETGLNLDKLDDETRSVWQAWKIAQVSSFVQDTSTALRKIRPGLRISAAVYATPRRLRTGSIEQEWETWVTNGWVDTLNPMTYVGTAKELGINGGYVRESTEDKALVFPGLSIRQLDTAGLIEQMDTARQIGTLGTTMFAAAQLDDKKVAILKMGPYRRMPLLTPQQDPIRASRLLIDDFSALVNRYLQDPQKHILSDQASTNEVLTQIESVQRQMHELRPTASSEDLAEANKQVNNLQSLVRDWLRIEAFVQRGFRAQYITGYLAQLQAVLSYATHKAKTHQVQVISDTNPNLRHAE
jgi:uncharacterized lipoprotein YddW (UPF0748 family)